MFDHVLRSIQSGEDLSGALLNWVSINRYMHSHGMPVASSFSSSSRYSYRIANSLKLKRNVSSALVAFLVWCRHHLSYFFRSLSDVGVVNAIFIDHYWSQRVSSSPWYCGFRRQNFPSRSFIVTCDNYITHFLPHKINREGRIEQKPFGVQRECRPDHFVLCKRGREKFTVMRIEISWWTDDKRIPKKVFHTSLFPLWR